MNSIQITKNGHMRKEKIKNKKEIAEYKSEGKQEK
jgi:hypothetical protein